MFILSFIVILLNIRNIMQNSIGAFRVNSMKCDVVTSFIAYMHKSSMVSVLLT